MPTLSSSPPRSADFVVVGAGIVGLATARELSIRHPGASIAVLEREDRIAAHQSGHSSGVIHAGIYYKPGSLKAKLSVEGAARLYDYCHERGINARKPGKVIVATDPSELPRLDELERRGTANGVPGLRRISVEELLEIEPHCTGGIDALHSPETGVVDYNDVAAAYREDLEAAGGSVHTSCEVTGTEVEGDGVRINHRRAGNRNGAGPGSTLAGRVVLCAGAWSDRLAEDAGAEAEPRIVPFRGGFLNIKPERAGLVKTSIYPVPDPDLPFLGMHLTRDPHGEVHLGPSALMVGARDAYKLSRINPRDLGQTLAWPGTWKMMANFWRTGLTEMRHAASKRSIVRELQRFVPELSLDDVEPGHAGVRAQALNRDGSLVDDFVVSETEHAVHVRNAPSPAATSSLSMAELIADRVDQL